MMSGPWRPDTGATLGAVMSAYDTACKWRRVQLFDSSPAHSGLSSSKFTAKSCDTFHRGGGRGGEKTQKPLAPR